MSFTFWVETCFVSKLSTRLLNCDLQYDSCIEIQYEVLHDLNQKQ
jgi:hypothetical protein